MDKYGLLGESLKHSFSKTIHEMLGFYSYELLPMDKAALHSFLTRKEFKAVNVTIPYKQEVIPFCDFIDKSVELIGSANTIVNNNGALTAYNTDISGFLYMLSKKNISLAGKKVLILGSGATSESVLAATTKLKAKEVFIVSRTKSATTITYDEAISKTDIQIIINTSPVGMFPNNEQIPILINSFNKLEAVVDVIYNPLNTRLLQLAKNKGLAYSNGLLMLVAQAKFAAELFIGKSIDNSEIDRIYNALKFDLNNIVLVGMPSCGKTVIAKNLSELLNKDFIDVDSIIEQNENMPIPQIFEKYGEKHFREIEARAIKEISKQTNLIISTGGGAVLNPDNISNLKQNGIVFYINRSIDKLLIGGNRPLSKSKQAINDMFEKRHLIYLDCCDFEIMNNGQLDKAINEIKERFYEAVSY